MGIIATNSIGQGDTREVGLDQSVDLGWTVCRAEKSQKWPGSASLEVSLLWAGHPGEHESCVLDGAQVPGITPSLDPQSRTSGNPKRLAANAGICFQGSVVLGTGFMLEPEEAQALIGRDPRNEEVLPLYINGEDLNSRWDFSASRRVINFQDWPIERAQSYPDVFSIVIERVRPQRLATKQRDYRELWWRFARIGLARNDAIRGLDRVIVMALMSRTGLPARVRSDQVFSNALCVFATDDSADLTLLSSAQNFFWWTTKAESSLRSDPRYTPSDGYETLPRPAATSQMRQTGEALDSFRRAVMERSEIGLTALYNLVHDESVQESEIIRLREIHVEVDEAVQEAYALDEERESAIRAHEREETPAPLPSWREIELGHGFYDTRQGVRFTISPHARVDVLDKLLALNHYRYKQEVKAGLHSGKGRGTSKRKGAARAAAGTAPVLDDGGLFAPEGTLF